MVVKMIVKMVVKIQNHIFKYIFKQMMRYAILIMGQRIHLLWKLSLSILYLFDSIYQKKVLIDKLPNFEEGTCFPINGCHGKKSNFSLIIASIAMSKKCSIKNFNFLHLNYYWKYWVDSVGTRWNKTSQPQKFTFSEKEC